MSFPVSFEVLPFRRILVRNDGGTWGFEPDGQAVETPVLRSTDQTKWGEWSISEPAVRSLTPDERARTKLVKGDLVVTKSSGSLEHIGKTSIVDASVEDTNASFSNFMQRLRVSRENSPRFYWRLMQSEYFRNQIRIMSTTSTGLANLSRGQIGETLVPHPPLTVQAQIADHLDHETAEIDAAISDQIALIGLLEERKRVQKYRLATGQTLATSRGAEVVQFWGELPLDWSLQKLQWHFDIGNGSTPSTSTARFWDQDGFPWLNSSVVNQPSVVHPSRRVSHTALEELHLPIVPPGSLLMGITGQGKTRGMVTALDIEATINQHLAYLAPRSPQSPISVEYLRLALDVAYPELRQLSDGNGGTKGALTCHMLQQFRIPVPPKDLQAVLVTEARRETAATTQAVADAESFIALARERRAALITAAVTGQIDLTARNKPAAEQLEDDIAQGLHREN